MIREKRLLPGGPSGKPRASGDDPILRTLRREPIV